MSDQEEQETDTSERPTERFFRIAVGAFERVIALKDPYALAVYSVLAFRAKNDTRASWPSHKSIAADAGCSVATVKRSIDKLFDAGLIEVRARYWRDGEVRSDNDDPDSDRRGEQCSNLYVLCDGLGKGSSLRATPVAQTELPRGLSQSHPGSSQGATNKTKENKTKSNQTKGTTRSSRARAIEQDAETPQKQKALQLCDAYADGLGISRADFQGSAKANAYDAFKPETAKLDPATVRDLVTYLRSDPWWKVPGRLTPAAVLRTYPSWDAEGRPSERGTSNVRSGKKESNPDNLRMIEEALERRRAVIEIEMSDAEGRDAGVVTVNPPAPPPRPSPLIAIPEPPIRTPNIREMQAQAKRHREIFG